MEVQNDLSKSEASDQCFLSDRVSARLSRGQQAPIGPLAVFWRIFSFVLWDQISDLLCAKQSRTEKRRADPLSLLVFHVLTRKGPSFPRKKAARPGGLLLSRFSHTSPPPDFRPAGTPHLTQTARQSPAVSRFSGCDGKRLTPLSRRYGRIVFAAFQPLSHTSAATSHTSPIPDAPIRVYSAGLRSRQARLNRP